MTPEGVGGLMLDNNSHQLKRLFDPSLIENKLLPRGKSHLSSHNLFSNH
jgi:hypothetical protein